MDNIIKTLYNSIDTSNFLSEGYQEKESDAVLKVKSFLSDEGIVCFEGLMDLMFDANYKISLRSYEAGVKDGFKINNSINKESNF